MQADNQCKHALTNEPGRVWTVMVARRDDAVSCPEGEGDTRRRHRLYFAARISLLLGNGCDGDPE